MAQGLSAALARVRADLDRLERPYALVGGFAVSAISEPRFTRDLDFVVAVDSDEDAEAVISELGYPVRGTVEQTSAGRLATARLVAPATGGVVVDLLFASSSIEAEVAGAAVPMELVPGLSVPVATRAHLIALKVLSERGGREQDLMDLRGLLREASDLDLEVARGALDDISQRGFNRGKDLRRRLDEFEAEYRPGSPHGESR